MVYVLSVVRCRWSVVVLELWDWVMQIRFSLIVRVVGVVSQYKFVPCQVLSIGGWESMVVSCRSCQWSAVVDQ